MKVSASSVLFKIFVVVFTGMLILTIVLVSGVHTDINKQMSQFAQEQLDINENLFNLQIDDSEEHMEDALAWLNAYLNECPLEKIKNVLSTGKIDNLDEIDLSTLYYTDATGTVHRSPKADYTVPADFKAKVESKGKFTDLIKEGSKFYILSGLYIRDEKASMYLMTDISSAEFLEMLKEKTNCEVTVFDSYKRAMSTMKGQTGTEIGDKSIIDSVMSGNEIRRIASINGVSYVANYFPIHNAEGKIITAGYLGSEMSRINKLRDTIVSNVRIVTSFLCLVIVVVILLFLNRYVLRPLRRIGGAMKNLASGQADLTFRVDYSSKDEFGEIAEDVNIFIEMMQDIMVQITAAEKSLSQVGMELKESSDATASATTEIMSNIQSVKEQSKTQNSSVEKTEAEISKANSDTDTLGGLIDNQAAGINESSASIEQMLGNIKNVSTSIQNMSSNFNELSETVAMGNNRLNDVSDKIKTIEAQSANLVQANQIIASIASQTNLLAMNAAIEAAHAGEVGKGFAVVADEIRALAENSSKQSVSIKNELKEITNSIKAVVDSSLSAQTAFGQIVDGIGYTKNTIGNIGNSMIEQEEGSKQVLEALSSIKSGSEEVRSLSIALRERFKNVNELVGNVSELSSNILNSMDEMNEGSTLISRSTQNVNDLANATTGDIDTLRKLLGKFVI